MDLILIKEKREKVNDMRRLFFKISLLVVAVVAFVGIGFAFNGFGLTTIAYAEELEYTATGSCGTSANWYYYEETSTLRIDGSGSINTYNVGATPWYSYRDSIKKIIVSDDITSISASLFSGMSALEELTIPFVGRDQTIYRGTSCYDAESYRHYPLGYMFGTTSYANSLSVYQYAYSLDYIKTNANNTYYSYHTDPTTRYYIPATLKKVNITNSTYLFGGAFSFVYDSNYSKFPLNITEVTLNEGIQAIGSHAFYGGDYLERVNLPSAITTVDKYTFYNCFKLGNIEIPDSVGSIQDYAFHRCNSLYTEIGSGVKTIGQYSFYNCTSLTNQTFPSTLTTIGSYAFAGCSSFTEINIP